MKRIKRFIRVDFENGNHYQSAKSEVDGKDLEVRFRIDFKGILIQTVDASYFYPAGSYNFVTWK